MQAILSRDSFFHAWLVSPSFELDLEELYTVHLPTQAEWKEYLEVIYHDFLKKSLADKERYQKNFSEVEAQFNKRQDFLILITSMLMDERPRSTSAMSSDAGSNASVVPRAKFFTFVEKIIAKSKRLFDD
jgi:hypothetical protein